MSKVLRTPSGQRTPGIPKGSPGVPALPGPTSRPQPGQGHAGHLRRQPHPKVPAHAVAPFPSWLPYLLPVASTFSPSLGVTEAETGRVQGPWRDPEPRSPVRLKQGPEAGGGEAGYLSRLFPSALCQEGGGGVSCLLKSSIAQLLAGENLRPRAGGISGKRVAFAFGPSSYSLTFQFLLR